MSKLKINTETRVLPAVPATDGFTVALTDVLTLPFMGDDEYLDHFGAKVAVGAAALGGFVSGSVVARKRMRAGREPFLAVFG